MQINLRPAIAADAAECGRICYEAFSGIAAAHRFPDDWGSGEVAVKVIEARLSHRLTYGVVAETRGSIVGSAFLKMYRPVGAIGPVTVSPDAQGSQAGRLMMEHLLERAHLAGLAGTRLVQAAYNTASLALYTKLGFQVREMLACLLGRPIGAHVRNVGPGEPGDIEACDRLCLRLHGYARLDDISEALRLGFFRVVRREGRITGYTTGIHFRGHTVGETNEDAKLLIATAQDLPEPGLLMPAGNGDLLRWALENGLRITQPLSLMTLGFYQHPEGAFLPSIHA
ncbi:MAG TPA: GNAT family N-acetyltransferase [Chthoniobacteraceae bacterium]|jgi:ribosomal protein S18 acetylase RimI-like enzyme|nr:GNAT family N-acetyltransferase [Chthoniobacteraceae bacterium]